MFTGLVEEIGQVASVAVKKGKTRVTIRGKRVPSALKLGDSVAVSGVCLTAVEAGRKQFSADLAEETLERTSLGRLKKGAWVNLELPARAQDRLGGHVVQGHVDGVGRLLSLQRVRGGEDWRLVIEIPHTLERYVVSQGSITVEGISLTVAQIAGNRVEIAIIPHTYRVTNLQTLRTGSLLNIEVDVLAKYAEKAGGATGKLTVEDLVKQGF